MKRIIFILLLLVPVFFLSEVGAQSKKKKPKQIGREATQRLLNQRGATAQRRVEAINRESDKKLSELRGQASKAAKRCFDATVRGASDAAKTFREMKKKTEERRKRKRD